MVCPALPKPRSNPARPAWRRHLASDSPPGAVRSRGRRAHVLAALMHGGHCEKNAHRVSGTRPEVMTRTPRFLDCSWPLDSLHDRLVPLGTVATLHGIGYWTDTVCHKS